MWPSRSGGNYSFGLEANMDTMQFGGIGLWESPFKRSMQSNTSKRPSTSWMTIVKRDSAIHLDDDDSTIAPTECSSAASVDGRQQSRKTNYADSSAQTTSGVSQASYPSCIKCIRGARLPRKPLLWDLHISDGRISSIEPHDFNSSSQAHVEGVLDAEGRLITPSLCHAHIHLDKCFLLQDPRYSDLQIVKGDFNEAMSLTSKAKSRFTSADLLRRGTRLIEESIMAGVTSMRAFVEVDAEVQFKCLDAGIQLKKEYAQSGRMDIQICAFAQVPLFTGSDHGAAARKLMTQAAEWPEVDVLGSTPYVESDQIKGKMNVRWVTGLALKKQKMLDFHLDYYVDAIKPPLIWNVLDLIKESHWNYRGGKQITLGHCTRLTLFNPSDWEKLNHIIKASNLPISFVGLPTSDLFMMRPQHNIHHHRGTLPIPEMIKTHHLKAAIAINNVCNAFTPQGSCDPLTLASSAVGIYSAGTNSDTELLYECISSRARSAIGLQEGLSLDVKVREPANLIIMAKDEECEWRTRKSISELVYDPIGVSRTTLLRGQVTTIPPQSSYEKPAFIPAPRKAAMVAKGGDTDSALVQVQRSEPTQAPLPAPSPVKVEIPDPFHGSRMRDFVPVRPVYLATSELQQESSTGLWPTPSKTTETHVPSKRTVKEEEKSPTPNTPSSAYTLVVSYNGISTAYHYSCSSISYSSHSAYALHTAYRGINRVYNFEGGFSGKQDQNMTISTVRESSPKVKTTTTATSAYTLIVNYGGSSRAYHYSGSSNSHSSHSVYSLHTTYMNELRGYHFEGGMNPRDTTAVSRRKEHAKALATTDIKSDASAYTLSVNYGGGDLKYHYNGGLSPYSGSGQSAYTLLVNYGGSSRLYHFAGGDAVASPIAKAISPPVPEKRFSPSIIEKRRSFQMPVFDKRLSWPAPVPEKPRALRSSVASGNRDMRLSRTSPSAFTLSVRYPDGAERAYHYNGGHHLATGGIQSAYTLTVDYGGSPRVYHFDGGASRLKRASAPVPRKPQLLRSRTSSGGGFVADLRQTTFAVPYTLTTEFGGVRRDYHYNGGAPSQTSSSTSAYALIAEYPDSSRMYTFHGGSEEAKSQDLSPFQLSVKYEGVEKRYEFNVDAQRAVGAAYSLSVTYDGVERRHFFDIGYTSTENFDGTSETAYRISSPQNTRFGSRNPLISHPASWKSALSSTSLNPAVSHPASWSSVQSTNTTTASYHPLSRNRAAPILPATTYKPPVSPTVARSRPISRIPTPRGVSRSPTSTRRAEHHDGSASKAEISPFMLSANYGDGVGRVYHFNSGSGSSTSTASSAWKLNVNYDNKNGGSDSESERVYYSTYI